MNHALVDARRFAFGENWQRFLAEVDEPRIVAAERSLQAMLGASNLEGKSFLDVGSGSGLFSLAARRLGASVTSFDYDPNSVACSLELRQRYRPGDADWKVETGSVLDSDFLNRLGRFDVVYSWGVLHHTGNMWRALELATKRVTPHGMLFIALYNDQGWISRYWRAVKRLYNRGPLGRLTMIVMHLPYLFGLRYVVRAVRSQGGLERGMTLWYDMFDWLGGLPFEVAKPDAVVAYCAARGFALTKAKFCGRRHGCNEFIFRNTHTT